MYKELRYLLCKHFRSEFFTHQWNLQYASEGVHWVLKGPPEGSIHHDTSKAFPQIFILFTYQTSLIKWNMKTNKQTGFQWDPR